VKKLIGAACATAALFLSASVANAATVYQGTFQGATFTVTQNSDTNITFNIAGVNDLSDNWTGVKYLGAFAFNGLGASAAKAVLVGGTPANTATSIDGGLNGNKGCNGNGAGICFDFTPNISTNTSNLTFDITATSGIFNFDAAGPHLKLAWTNDAMVDKPVGDLGSDKIKFSLVPTSAVPEPATWAMMIAGFGLAGAAIRRRRGTLAFA